MEQINPKVIDMAELTADNGRSLIFEIGANLWTRISIKGENDIQPVMEADFVFLIHRFIHTFETTEHEYTGTIIDGNKVFKICTMEGAEHAIVGTYLPDKLMIYMAEMPYLSPVIDMLEIKKENWMPWLRKLVELSLSQQHLTDKRKRKRIGKGFVDLFKKLFKPAGKK